MLSGRLLFIGLACATSSGCALLVDLGGPVERENVVVGTGSKPPDDGPSTAQGEGGAPAQLPAPPPPTCAADLAIDPSNCGFCGHGCGGATCSGGLCAPAKIVPQTNDLLAILGEEDRVFYMTERQVFACPAVPSSACTSLVTADQVGRAVGNNTSLAGLKLGISLGGEGPSGPPPSLELRALATYGDRFFVADETFGTVVACPKAGCSQSSISTVRPAANPDFSGGLFVDAFGIVWGEKNALGTTAVLPGPNERVDGRLYENPLVRDVKRLEIGNVAGLEQTLFRGTDGVFALTAESWAVGAPQEIYQGSLARDFAADASFAYVVTNRSVIRVDRRTRVKTTIMELTGSELERIVADGNGVYATVRGATETGLVHLRGGGVDVLARAPSIGMISLSSRWIYYASDGAIFRVAR